VGKESKKKVSPACKDVVAIVFRVVASAGILLCALVSMQPSGTLYEQAGTLQTQIGTSIYHRRLIELMKGKV
jgi:hypothetical protein